MSDIALSEISPTHGFRGADTAPVQELDRLLRPLRRVLAYATRDHVTAAGVRYFESNAARWVGPATALDLPEGISELLTEMAAATLGIDALETDERVRRLGTMYQALARIDAILGLPLERRVLVPTPVEQVVAQVERISRDGYDFDVEPGLEPAEPEPLQAVEPEGAERRWRLGDPATTGRLLSAFDLDAGLVQAFAEEGVESVADLLQLGPSGEEIVRPVHGAGREVPAGRAAVGGRVVRRVTRLSPSGERRTEVLLHGAGHLRAVWRGGLPAWMLDRLAPETRVVLVGEMGAGDDGDPVLWDAEPAVPDGHHAVHLARYDLEGIEDAVARRLIWRWMPELDRLRDPVSADMLARLGLPGLGEALRDLHTRGSGRPEARRRLAFDEALLLQLGLASPRFQAGRERGIGHGILHGLAARVCQFAEVSPGDAQQLALEEIKRDLRSAAPMQRVLTGPAGTGKTMVALLAAVAVAESKSQVMFLAGEGATAELRYLFAEPLLREVGLVGRIVVGEPSRAQRDAIRRGEVHIVFGTVDLLDRGLEFRRLGLVIAEEQEVHGSVPRKIAALRAPRPDLLLLETTPVPAAVLLSAYGDLDLSVVDGPKRVMKATILGEDKREEAYAVAKQALAQHQQVLVLFPMARQATEGDEGGVVLVDALDLRAARQVVEALEAEIFPGRRLALFHGSMSREERWRVYDDFRHRRTDVLVATGHIEEGPPVPAAAVAVVEQADRMPLWRLQRIRGYLLTGNPDVQGVFVTGAVPDEAGRERLERFARDPDDWALAEWDIGVRGLEPMLDTEGPAAARLRWLDPGTDRDLLLWAREQAHAMLEEDPALRRGAHGDLGRTLRDRWDDLLNAPCPLPEAGQAAQPRRRRRRRKRK